MKLSIQELVASCLFKNVMMVVISFWSQKSQIFSKKKTLHREMLAHEIKNVIGY
jgi:hypothetical protein